MVEQLEHAFPEATYHHLFGLESQKDVAFAEEVVQALQQIDRALLPPAGTHPMGELIKQGVKAAPRLIELAKTGDPLEMDDALDALAHILVYEPAADDVVLELRGMLEQEEDPERRGVIAKLLAMGLDEGFLTEQIKRLADDDPGVVATAARLLGFGRYAPAVKVLRELVSPDRIYESRYVIWALGETASPEAIPTLEHCLAQGFRTVDCMIALGKIGMVTSIPKLTPMIVDGVEEQRDAAYRALAMILDKNREQVARVPDLQRELSGLIQTQLGDPQLKLSGSTRFHMCLCLARLGQKLDPAGVRRILKIKIGEQEAGAMASYFVNRGGKK